MGAVYVEVNSTDPAEFEQALRPWELLCRPTTAGPFSHCVQMFAGADFLLYREHYDSGVHLGGLTPDGMLLIGIPVAKGSNSRFWGKAQPSHNVPFALPGPVDGVLAPGYEQLVAGIRVDSLRRGMSQRVLDRVEIAAHSYVICCHSQLRNRIAHWIHSVLTRAATHPEIMNSAAALEALSDELLGFFVLVGQQAEGFERKRSPSASRLGLDRALDFIRNAPLCDVRLSRLCEVSGISERSLQYAFRGRLGMTPKEFITRRRLHAARQALLESDPLCTHVSEVATGFGFYELGRFAGQYRKQFGERPSETLKRES